MGTTNVKLYLHSVYVVGVDINTDMEGIGCQSAVASSEILNAIF
jgi:hypothetical protein